MASEHYPEPAPQSTSGKAIFSLVCGVLSLCLPILPAIPGIILGFLGIRDINQGDGRVGGRGLAITGLVLSTLGLLCGCLGASGGGFFYFRYHVANKRAKSENNLKQIALAFHNYASTYQDKLPAAAIVDNEKPILSWRVTILPYIEEDNRYKQFDLTKPWDISRNRSLLVPKPRIYIDPEIDLGLEETSYRCFVGPNTMFPDPSMRSAYTIANIPDGTSNTILAVQDSYGVPWSNPEELTYIPGQTISRLGPPGRSYFLAVMYDGSVRMVSKTISDQTLRNAIDPRDGNPLGFDW
jgi:hypothetical protein